MPSPVDRIRALLRLASHPGTPEKEASAAALIACKLMAEHNLDLAPRDQALKYESGFKDGYAQGVEDKQADAKPRVQPKTAAPKPKARTAPSDFHFGAEALGDKDFMTIDEYEQTQRSHSRELYRDINSKFDGRCRSCQEPYEVGERIAWMPTVGATHFDCRDYWDDQ
jgi:hypothetical protein